MNEYVAQLMETNIKLTGKTVDYDRLKLVAEKLRNDNSLNNKQLAKYEDDITQLRKEQKEADELIRSLRLEDKVKTNIISSLNNKNKKAMQEVSNLSSRLYKMNRINNGLNEDIVRLK